jgi:hypothetical protein
MRVYPIWFYSALATLALVQAMLSRVGSRHAVDDVDVWQVAFVAGGYRPALGFNAIEDDDLRWALKKAAGTARAGGD